MTGDAYATYMTNITRKSEYLRIMTDPSYIIFNIRPTKDNGWGKQVPDLSQPSVPYSVGPVLIAPLSTPLLTTQGTSEVFAIQSKFLLVGTYEATWIKEGIIFDWNARKMKVDIPTRITKFGNVISIQAELEDVTQDAGAVITALSLGDIGIPVVVGG